MVKKKDLCILHIGMPKTGTSTIQENFFKKVEDKRVKYTELGCSNQSGHLYGLFLEDVENYHFFKQQNFTLTDIERFRTNTKKKLEQNFLNDSHSIYILSGEDLYHSQTNAIIQMKEYLDIFFRKILVVAYVRPAYPFCNSAFQQMVKYPDNGSFNPNLIYHKYKNIERYDKVYGNENVKVIPFIPSGFMDNDIIADFCHHTGIKKQYSTIKVANEAISKAAVSILFTFNFHKNVTTDYGYKNYQIHYRIVEKLSSISGEKFKFAGSLIQSWIDDYYKEDYQWVLDRIPQGLSNDFLIDTKEEGVQSEIELMNYATNYIDELSSMVSSKFIDFSLSKHPQTVARLVNAMRKQIASEMK